MTKIELLTAQLRSYQLLAFELNSEHYYHQAKRIQAMLAELHNIDNQETAIIEV